MRATATPASIRKGKGRLLESCAVAAGMAALACGGPALAQVNANPVYVDVGAGTSVLNNNATNTTTVTVTQAQSIINWVPTDTAPTGGPIDILPTGENWDFIGNGQYTVLNRFVNGAGGSLSRQIALSGTINSYVGSTTGPQGGNIWFYNAGGILIGSGAAINVGSLVLTANDIDTSGGLFGPGGEIRFRGASGSTASIDIAGNSFIGASNGNPGNSYVALVAPRITQSGVVNSDGSIAYVAAEQADIRINNGLFDINVLVGAEGGNVITHSGTTTGPAHQDGDSDQSRIYMVAIPKNDAVTMLVAGSVGYQDAASAQVEPDGAVRLSAGFNITNGEIDAAPVNATAANMTIRDTLFESSVDAHASGALVAGPLAQVPVGGPVAVPPPPGLGLFFVKGSGTFDGDASASLTVGAGQAAGATGDLTIRSTGAGGAPGNASVTVAGGTLGVSNTLSITSSGLVQAATGDSQGGTSSLTITGGTVIAPAVEVLANGIADIGTSGTGGNGTGGNASLSISNAGSALDADTILVQASGRGDGLFLDASGALNAVDNGGDGQGGTATMTVANGAVVGPASTILLDAGGNGGTGLIQSGDGRGGTARLQITGAGTSVSTLQTFIDAGGDGGTGVSNPFGSAVLTQNGGDAFGGTAELIINADISATASLGSLGITTLARGGDASGSEGAAGGDAVGGTTTATADGGIDAQFTAMTLNASARAGSGTSPSGSSGLNGTADAGTVTLGATNGTTISNSGDIRLFAVGMGVAGENYATGAGGDIAVNATAGGSITAATQIIAQAMGGSSTFSAAESAGAGTGGNIVLTADGGTISTAFYSFDASGLTVDVLGTGGAAQGGTIDLLASNAGRIESTDISAINDFIADGIAGSSTGGSPATGGAIQLIANAGTIDLTGSTLLSANGITAGDLSSGGGAPVGRGGTLLIRLAADPANSSAINFGFLTGNADGSAQTASEVPLGSIAVGTANGQGGSTTIDVQGGALVANTIDLSAYGMGGAVGPNSGTGQGGTAAFSQSGGDVQVGDLMLGADGIGGPSLGTAGTGIGGTATATLTGGTLTASNLVATANGRGANGMDGDDFSSVPLPTGNGGAGQGGTATIRIDGADVTIFNGIEAHATGQGGGGGDYFASSTASDAGDGGNGTGGNASITMVSGALSTANLIADASGTGGAGGTVFGSGSSGPIAGVGVGGTGGIGQGGTATIDQAAMVSTDGAVAAIAAGIGGAGGSGTIGGNGGAGLGGLAQFIIRDFDAGTLGISVDATARGGNGGSSDDGDGADGGAATGGTGRIQADGPNANVTVTQANFSTDGTGGNGGAAFVGFGTTPPVGFTGGNGGNGAGGTLDVIANDGAAVTISSVTGGPVTLSSSGIGGNGADGAFNNFGSGLLGGNGGNGGGAAGGTVHLLANGGTIGSGGAPVSIIVGGTAGAGGLGGTGSAGNGADGIALGTSGGRAIVEALASATGPGQILFGDTTITATGDTAGRIELRSAGLISMTSLTAEALGTAPPTNNDTDVAPAGIFLAVDDGQIATGGAASLTTDSSVGVYARSSGMVDVGGDLAINAGDQIDIRHDSLTGTAPTIQAGGSLIATAPTSISGTAGSLIDAGTALSLTSSGGPVGINQANAGGTITVAAAGDIAGTFVSGGDVRLNAGGNIVASATANGGYVDPNGGTALGDLLADAAGSITLTNSAAARLFSVSAGQAATINGGTAGQDMLVAAGTTASLANVSAGRDILVTATNGVGVTGPAVAGRDITIAAASADFANLTDSSGATIDTLSAGRNVTISASGAITGGSVAALGNVAASAGTTIDVASVAGGAVALVGATGVTVDSLSSQGATNLVSGNGAVAVGALASAAPVNVSANSMAIAGSGDLTFASLNADVGNAVVSATGNLSVAGGSVAGLADFSSGGDQLAIGSLTAGNVQLTAANGAIALTNIASSGSVDAAALGTIQIDGTVTGQAISLTSGDIDIGSAGRVGTAGVTNSLQIRNSNANAPTFIGGTGARSGYHIDADELTRLYGGTISVFAPAVQDAGVASLGSAAPPDVIIDSFTMAGGASSAPNIGANGSLSIMTPGKARVIGNVQLTGLSAGNSLTIDAGDAIEVILGQGSIRLVNGSTPTGMLNLVSDDVIVATSAAIADVAAAATIGAINDRLAQNDGIASDDGALYAGGIRADVVGGFYVQNSGAGTAFDQRRGLTFGAQGLDVVTSGPSRIVVNGVQLTSAGQVTGRDVVPLLTIAGGPVSSAAGSFDRGSTLNGCLILGGLSCSLFPSSGAGPGFPVQDLVHGLIDGGDPGQTDDDGDSDSDGDGTRITAAADMLITVRDLDPLSGEPLLDDPVTGAGNDDLWTPPSE